MDGGWWVCTGCCSKSLYSAAARQRSAQQVHMNAIQADGEGVLNDLPCFVVSCATVRRVAGSNGGVFFCWNRKRHIRVLNAYFTQKIPFHPICNIGWFLCSPVSFSSRHSAVLPALYYMHFIVLVPLVRCLCSGRHGMAWCPITGYRAQPRGGRRVFVEPVAVGNRGGHGFELRADPDSLLQQRVRAGITASGPC